MHKSVQCATLSYRQLPIERDTMISVVLHSLVSENAFPKRHIQSSYNQFQNPQHLLVQHY
jgi:hypothetical protein